MTGSLDRHGRRLVRQRHDRIRRRHIQDRAGVAAQAIRRPGRARIGDVPVGLVVELEASPPVAGLQDTAGGGNQVPSTSSGTSRLTVGGGTEIRPLQAASSRSSCSAATDSTYTYHNQEPNPRKQQKPLNSSIPLQRSHHGIRTTTRVCVHDSSNEPYPPLDGRLQYRDAMR